MKKIEKKRDKDLPNINLIEMYLLDIIESVNIDEVMTEFVIELIEEFWEKSNRNFKVDVGFEKELAEKTRDQCIKIICFKLFKHFFKASNFNEIMRKNRENN